jgi:hypothetical protein
LDQEVALLALVVMGVVELVVMVVGLAVSLLLNTLDFVLFY